MIRRFVRVLVLTPLLAAILAPPSAAGQQQEAEPPGKGKAEWGKLVYPLHGNIRSGRGTLLVRFRIDEKVHTAPGPWYQPVPDYYRLNVVNVEVNEQHGFGITGQSKHQDKDDAQPYITQFMASVAMPGENEGASAPNVFGGRDLHAGQIYVIAYTWDQQGVHRFWRHGELQGEETMPYPAQGLGGVDPAHSRLTFGQGHSGVTLLGVHILGRAWPKEKINRPSDKLFEPTRHSLLLDTYEDASFKPDGQTQTQAEVIAGFSEEEGGVPSPACRFVETSYGPGLRLYTPPPGTSLPAPASRPSEF